MTHTANVMVTAVVLIIAAAVWNLAGPLGVAIFITTSAAMTEGTFH